MGTALKSEDFTVAFATNGKTAIEYIHKKMPDLVLLDIMMPEMDGYEVCKRIKEDTKTMHIPIIFITAMSDADDEYRGFELGGADYITKPFNSKLVKARVECQLRLKRKTDLLEKLSSIDGLTEIPNRRQFDEIFANEWARARRAQSNISLILIDIDFFKQYNDHYGHAAGDKCLQKVSKTLHKSVKRPADFVARYGGEEFVVILPEIDHDSALLIASQLKDTISQLELPHEASQLSRYVTISLGLATTIPQNDQRHEILLETADKYLYDAKSSGRNQVKGILF
ncbi:MAG: response regulator receiver modulated diguanylate cyclase [Candidatus Magnetoglobus multicellularis str. Araruama]|uniref:diguanylate cyclase n=1 Tax=Candidatus Magnetoglobus multicellularis str. Araruama TaxID=890399 RepID=A0A1V1P0N8_9BACT|nr:MAG: response regulator receiver modulated diguanylate cyclase [Candidatus Magnetoglobus multicellularis str. Araruama]